MNNPEIVAYVYAVSAPEDEMEDAKMGYDDSTTDEDVPNLQKNLSEDYA